METGSTSGLSSEWGSPEMQRACQALISGNLGAALTEINDRISREEEKPEAICFWVRGVIHEVMGNYHEALRDMLRGAALSGATKHHVQQDIWRVVCKVEKDGLSAPWVKMVKAQCQAANRDYKAAIATLGDIKSPMAEYLRSLCYLSIGDQENAVTHANMFMTLTGMGDIRARERAIEMIERAFRVVKSKKVKELKKGGNGNGERSEST